MPLAFDNQTIQALNSDAVTTFFLYEIPYGDDAAQVLRYTNWMPKDNGDGTAPVVVYMSNPYTPNVIKHSDIRQSSDGKIEDMTVQVGNADRIIQGYVENYEMMGKQVIITQIIKKVDGSLAGIEMAYRIKKVSCKKDYATFTLSIGIDMLQSVFPSRKILSRFCWWVFKDEDCAYTGSATECDRSFDNCKRLKNTARFGGFPGVLRERFYF